jgi:hypothetical protein
MLLGRLALVCAPVELAEAEVAGAASGRILRSLTKANTSR